MKGLIFAFVLPILIGSATADEFDNAAAAGGVLVYFLVSILPFIVLICCCIGCCCFIVKACGSNNVTVVNSPASYPMPIPIACNPTGPPAYSGLEYK